MSKSQSNTKTQAEIFQEIFKEYGYTAYSVARDLGKVSNHSKYQKLLSGESDTQFSSIREMVKLFKHLNPNFLLRGEYPIRLESNAKDLGSIHDLEFVEVPFVSIKAQAGFIATFPDDYEKLEVETIKVPATAVRNLKITQCFQVEGNSMEPQLKNGSKILGELIENADWVYLNGGVYAILFDSKFVIKRIKTNNIRKGELELHSDNEMHGSLTIDSKGLNDFIDTPLEEILRSYDDCKP